MVGGSHGGVQTGAVVALEVAGDREPVCPFGVWRRNPASLGASKGFFEPAGDELQFAESQAGIDEGPLDVFDLAAQLVECERSTSGSPRHMWSALV